jgi:PPOX class probable F420-dependent enzyme
VDGSLHKAPVGGEGTGKYPTDRATVALAAFLVGNTIHAVNHALDLDHGGRASDPWLLAVLSLAAAGAFVLRYRQLGHILGRTATGPSTPELMRFVRQKTISLTSYRKDGRPVSTPVSIAVDGDRAIVRSYERAWKTRRLANNPTIEIAPSTAKGTPTGPAVTGRARRLTGVESQHAARLLRRKYPLLHGLVVPLTHRTRRAKTGRTVHFEVTMVKPSLGRREGA